MIANKDIVIACLTHVAHELSYSENDPEYQYLVSEILDKSSDSVTGRDFVTVENKIWELVNQTEGN